jgi:hypothetical protein
LAAFQQGRPNVVAGLMFGSTQSQWLS